MPTEGRTAGSYKSDRVNQKPGMPGARPSVSDVFDANGVRPSQHLIAYEWAAQSGAAGGAGGQKPGNARLELPLRRFPIEPGLNLLFRVHERRRLCVGYRERNTLKRLPCPHQGEELGSVERGPDYARVFQCSACAELEGVPEWLRHEAMPRWVGLETPSPEALEQAPYLSEPHVVYLAAFGPGRVKVGVAIERRVRLRFLEQGAHLGAVIARCPEGFAARRMERA